MNDLISRQAAIDLIENESRKWGDEYGVSDVLCDLADLPSVQAEPKQITPSDQEKSDKFGVKSGKTCADTISRQAAIGLIERMKPYHQNADDIAEMIANMPSAQPEQTLYGYPIEHLAMIARVMAKENCTPEVVAQMLQNAGEIAKMVRDKMMEMLKESIERPCKGEANEFTFNIGDNITRNL